MRVKFPLRKSHIPSNDEIHLVATEFAKQGCFEALIHQDPCPDNCFLGEEGMRLLDFEHGRFGHALQDGVYPRIHFPTCWCVNRIPKSVWKRAEAAYWDLSRAVPKLRMTKHSTVPLPSHVRTGQCSHSLNG